LPIITDKPYYDKFGLKKTRRCLHCDKDIIDDGTVMYLRGFCSDDCHQKYLEQARKSKR
jgi:hypothetical protein